MPALHVFFSSAEDPSSPMILVCVTNSSALLTSNRYSANTVGENPGCCQEEEAALPGEKWVFNSDRIGGVRGSLAPELLSSGF